MPFVGRATNSVKLPSVAKKSVGRLLKRAQRRGARKIDERRRTYQHVGVRRLSATKHMRLFQQPATQSRARPTSGRMPTTLKNSPWMETSCAGLTSRKERESNK
jgi:hypothetical protein